MYKVFFTTLFLIQTLFGFGEVDKRDVDAVVEVRNSSHDSKKQELIKSLKKEKNIIIYDLDYNSFVAIAVGEDNSLDTRIKASQDEYHLGLSMYSLDGGKHWRRTFESFLPFQKVLLERKSKKAVMMGSIEGDGGIIARTIDAGEHWKYVYDGDFLYDMIYSDGYIAVGHNILKSKDGKSWKVVYKLKDTELFTVKDVGNHHIIALGSGVILYSKDHGKSWQKAKYPKSIDGIYLRYIIRKGKKLYAKSDLKLEAEIVSRDNGESWTMVE